MTLALLFPGQGSQSVGMGKALAEAFTPARLLFQEVDDALSQHLSRLMFEGPIEDLTLTENAQPALMAHSLAVIRVLEQDGSWKIGDKAAFVAGHSLGEYSALAAAGAFTVGDAARLLKLRGQAMQKAVPIGLGSMAALIGVELGPMVEIAEAAAQGEIVAAANDNGGGQVVLSGHKTAVDRAIAIAAERGFKRAIPLSVSAPFHCDLMKPAADAMAEALDQVDIRVPHPPVVANVTAATASDPAEIRDLLVRQVTGTVRWRECVLFMKEHGVDKLAEIGPGKVLSGLVRRIDKELSSMAVGEPADIEAFLKG